MTPAALQVERLRPLLLLLSVVTALTASGVAALQADAGIRAEEANRESQFYALQASGALQREGLRASYELLVLARLLRSSLEATVLVLAASNLDVQGSLEAAEETIDRALATAARARATSRLSSLAADPRFAGPSPPDASHLQAYVQERLSAASELADRQRAASDAYRRWDGRADRYVAVLTLLAIALLLFGLAQAVPPGRSTLLFAGLALLSLLAGSLWTALIYRS